MRKISPLIVILYLAGHTYASDSGLNVLSYQVTIEPDIQNQYVHGSVVIKFQLPLHKTSVVFNSGNLEIDSISGPSVISFQKVGDKLAIALSKERRLIEEMVIYYHGNPSRGLLFDRSKDLAYTVYFTSDWMVCNDIPGDKAKIDLNIIVDKGRDCIANGQLIRISPKNEKALFQWSQDFETSPYTYGFVIGNFQKYKIEYDELTINNYAKNYLPEELLEIFEETSKMITFFEEKSGIKYDQLVYSQVLIGNHYQEMSGFSVLKDSYGNLVLADSTETNLISHELAHQWWGNRITCESWNHFWLNEALATYMSAAYNQYRFGEKKYQADINTYFKVYQDLRERNRDKPLVFKEWTNPTKDDRSIVYFKGAYVLHLLREEIGDELFWKGLKSYSEEYFDKLVTTSDLQNAFEEVAERSLGDFFEEWIY